MPEVSHNYILQQMHAQRWIIEEIARLKAQGYVEIAPGTWESPDKLTLVYL